ncbi:MAG: GDP-mannose 4,6-dehydratase [Planctomycetota bacterium]
MSRTILVTGAAGFIGSHVAEALLRRGDVVVGIDNFNSYYDPLRKRANLAEVRQASADSPRFEFVEADLRDEAALRAIFEKHTFDGIIHLAAMAGVRASIDNPALYYDVNVMATLRLLDGALGRLTGKTPARLPTFAFASTSSAYGTTTRIPFVEDDPCNGPLAPYAASKRAGELLGFSYHHNFKIPFTALRFFTVYGPRNRPDMMAYKVIDNILFGRDVPLFNGGQMFRDWTFVGDIAQGLIAAVDRPLGFEVINLGRGEPVSLAEFIACIEALAGKKANLQSAPAPDTDMISTHADISKARRLLGYEPTTSVPEGVARLWAWYQSAVLGHPAAH